MKGNDEFWRGNQKTVCKCHNPRGVKISRNRFRGSSHFSLENAAMQIEFSCRKICVRQNEARFCFRRARSSAVRAGDS
jgi:hypothetical protein